MFLLQTSGGAATSLIVFLLVGLPITWLIMHYIIKGAVTAANEKFSQAVINEMRKTNHLLSALLTKEDVEEQEKSV